METLVCQKNKCTGCMACVDICPAGAVTIDDQVLNYNARIDEDKCSHCDSCRRVCQNDHPPVLRRPFLWKQGWAMDPAVRDSSSSGGFAAAIQKSFILDGGVVCSCVFSGGKFVFGFAENIEQARAFKGSRYVKSNPRGAYRRVRELLKQGRKVLFTGLPCQAAAVTNYCRDCQEGLYTIDLICHGTPSPKVLKSYLEGRKIDMDQLKDISFRCKRTYQDPEEHKVMPDGFLDFYMKCFLDCVILTDNCYECRYAAFERVSDLTLGDAWGSELPLQEKRRGISLALCMTPKGEELLNGADLYLTDVDMEKVMKVNTKLCRPAVKPGHHDTLLGGIAQGKSFSSMIRRFYPSLYYRESAKGVLSAAGLYKREGAFQKYKIKVVNKEHR